MKTQKRLHFYLVYGEVVFRLESGEISFLRCNAMIKSDRKELGERELGKAQQALQIQFHKKNEGSPIPMAVVDVGLCTFTYLGHMTDEEFAKPPEGMVKKEIAPAASPSEVN